MTDHPPSQLGKFKEVARRRDTDDLEHLRERMKKLLAHSQETIATLWEIVEASYDRVAETAARIEQQKRKKPE